MHGSGNRVYRLAMLTLTASKYLPTSTVSIQHIYTLLAISVQTKRLSYGSHMNSYTHPLTL